MPNYEASVSKIFDLYSNVWDREDEHALIAASFTQLYVYTIQLTIMGGSNEIQLGVIAARDLGLPRA